MPRYSETSKKRLATATAPLQRVFNHVIKFFDNTIVCGYRPPEEQLELFNEGKSKVKFGKHNKFPSEAVDAAPYPIDWTDTKRFIFFGGFVLGVASVLGVRLRWGGDWSMDTELKDNKFNDYVHFETIEK